MTNDELTHEMSDQASKHANEVNIIHEDYEQRIKTYEARITELELLLNHSKNRESILLEYLKDIHKSTKTLKREFERNMTSLEEDIPYSLWQCSTTG